MALYAECHLCLVECRSCRVLSMLSVVSFILIAIMLSVNMLGVFMLSDAMMSVVYAARC